MEWCVHRLFIASLLVQLQAFGGSKSQSLGGSSPPVVSPTATANESSPTGLLRPRPRPRPPPPVSPSNPGTPLAPRSLLLGQCIVGAESAQTNHIVEFANADRLYVDVGRPAECSGVVAWWEVCFGGHAAPMASTSLQIAVFRPGNSEMVYHLASVSNLSLVPGEPEAAEAICQSHDATTEVMVEQGDLIGFVSGDGVRIALSTYNATRRLHVYIQNIQGLLSALGPLQLSQLQQLRQAVAPLIRIVLNASTTNESSSMVPSPITTVTPFPPTEENNRGGALFKKILVCVTTVAVVVIAILLVLVSVLTCCICQDRCKLCVCCKLKTEVEPLEQTADQSMQYNDLYVPQNPTHIIRNGRRFTTQLHYNPAYGNPDHSAQQIASVVQTHNSDRDGQQIASSAPQTQDHTLNHNRTHREFDHTYESIK